MNWNSLLRTVHRWTSITFTATVIVAFLALIPQEPIAWLFYLPLPPLALLVFTGLYMFVLAYAAKWRGRRRAASAT